MTIHDHREDIMRALSTWKGKAGRVRFRPQAWEAIERAAAAASANIAEHRARIGRDRSGTMRRDEYDALVKHTEAALAAFRKVTADPYMAEPLGWAEGWEIENEAGISEPWVDWAGTDESVQATIGELETALDWVQRARDNSAADGIVRGRPMLPESAAMVGLAYDLGVVFQHHAQKPPTATGAQVAETHFESFVTAVAHAMGWKAEPGTVKAAIRRVHPATNVAFQLAVMEMAGHREATSPTERFAGVVINPDPDT
jgi:hypothetical protein